MVWQPEWMSDGFTVGCAVGCAVCPEAVALAVVKGSKQVFNCVNSRLYCRHPGLLMGLHIPRM